MAKTRISTDSHVETAPSLEILEGFARLHPMVMVADRDERLVFMSDALGLMCGGTDRYIGHCWTDLLPDGRVDEAGIRNRLRTAARDVRLEIPHGDNGPRVVDVTTFPVDNVDGGPWTVAIVRPVEERKQAGRELGDRPEFAAGILDCAPDPVLAFDRSSFITYTNPAAARMLGESVESLVGKPMALFLPQARAFGEIVVNFEPQGEFTAEEIEIRRGDGQLCWFSVSTRVLRDSGGRETGTAVFMRDVTDRHATQELLERQNAELESYVHNVSHDLRSPLVSLLGFSRLLRQDYESVFDDTGLHFLDRVEQAGRTMEALIHDLLELSRIGKSSEHRTLVDPRAVLMQLQAELKPRLDEQRVSLSMPANPPLLLCDRTRIYQVFSNLLGNALDHMGECADPRVAVEIREEPDVHHIAVKDNGKGVEPANHARIFEVFQSLGPRTDGRRSTGIGLAIIAKIAETHGGRAWVESSPGRGATFHVTLPRS
jgi:PAS domain S-box-containing protein